MDKKELGEQIKNCINNGCNFNMDGSTLSIWDADRNEYYRVDLDKISSLSLGMAGYDDSPKKNYSVQFCLRDTINFNIEAKNGDDAIEIARKRLANMSDEELRKIISLDNPNDKFAYVEEI